MRLLYVTLAGLAFGLLSGIAGVCIVHFNESAFGADYSQFRFDFLAIPSLPGEFISWIQSGSYDWSIDEGWDYRYWTVTWNTLFWLFILPVIFLIITSISRFFRFLIHLDRSHDKTEQDAAANP